MSSVKPKAHGLPNYDDIIKGAVRLLLLFFESLVTNLLSRSGMRMYRIDTTTRTPPMKDGLPKKLESKAHRGEDDRHCSFKILTHFTNPCRRPLD